MHNTNTASYQLVFSPPVVGSSDRLVLPQFEDARNELGKDRLLDLDVWVVSEDEVGHGGVSLVTPRNVQFVAGVDEDPHSHDDVNVDGKFELFQFVFGELSSVDDAHLFEECALAALARPQEKDLDRLTETALVPRQLTVDGTADEALPFGLVRRTTIQGRHCSQRQATSSDRHSRKRPISALLSLSVSVCLSPLLPFLPTFSIHSPASGLTFLYEIIEMIHYGSFYERFM